MTDQILSPASTLTPASLLAPLLTYYYYYYLYWLPLLVVNAATAQPVHLIFSAQ